MWSTKLKGEFDDCVTREVPSMRNWHRLLYTLNKGTKPCRAVSNINFMKQPILRQAIIARRGKSPKRWNYCQCTSLINAARWENFHMPCPAPAYPTDSTFEWSCTLSLLVSDFSCWIGPRKSRCVGREILRCASVDTAIAIPRFQINDCCCLKSSKRLINWRGAIIEVHAFFRESNGEAYGHSAFAQSLKSTL